MESARSAAKPFIIPVFIPHAGCPHRCLFCEQSHTEGGDASTLEPSAIAAQIERFLTYRRPDRAFTEISFYGGTFLGLAPERIERLLQVATAYVRRGSADGIRFSTRPDSISADRLALFDGYPVTTVELGVQSLNDEVLSLNRRGHTAADTLRAVTLLRRRSLSLGLQMMIGMPGQTAADALETGRRMAELQPDFVRIYPLLVLKGSPLEQWHRDGRYAPIRLDEAVALTRDLYRIFLGRGIRVIRMGLQPTAELAPGAAVVAGPFHPAFGELVLAAMWLERLRAFFGAEGIVGTAVTLGVAPKNLSAVKGQKNANLKALQQEFDLPVIRVHTNPDIGPDVIVINDKPCRHYSPIL